MASNICSATLARTTVMCILLVLLPACSAFKKPFTLVSRTHISLITPPIGLERGAHVEIHLNSFELKRSAQQQGAFEPVIILSAFTLQQWVTYRLDTSRELPLSVDPCNVPSARRFQITGYGAPEGNGRSLKFQAESTNQYYLTVLNCYKAAADQEILTEGFVLFANPDGQQLSLEQVPLKTVQTLFLVLFLTLTCVWGYHLFVSRFFRRIFGEQLRLQLSLAVALLCKCIENATELLYISSLASSGVESEALRLLRGIGETLANAVFLGVLLLMALGWTVVRSELTHRERQLFLGAFLMYLLFGVLHSICQEPNLCGAYLLSFYVIRFLITFCIIVATNANVERLRAGGVDGIDENNATAVYTKLRTFQLFRAAFLSYLICPIVFMFIQVTVLTWQDSWVLVVLNEALFLGVFMTVTHAFRLRGPGRVRVRDRVWDNPRAEEMNLLNEGNGNQ